ncbi:hypothetical protein ACW9YV_15000 (plasmid) [Paraburkholderia strydomiana]
MSQKKVSIAGLDIDLFRAGVGRPLLFLHPHLGRGGLQRSFLS